VSSQPNEPLDNRSDQLTSPQTQPQAVYYHPPVQHQDHLKKMGIWLSVFFVSLFILLILVISFADKLVVHLPFAAEKQFVKPYETMAGHIFDEKKSENEIYVQNYLQSLTDKVVKASELPDDITIEVHYLNNGAINAFATLGGHIFICRGLIEAMPDENSLAMVIGHEIAHIKHRDPAVGMTRGLALQLIYSFVTGDYTSSDLAGYGSELGLLYFSREQEKNADIAAIYALEKTFGHVAGFDKIFTVIQSESEKEEQEEEQKSTRDKVVANWLSSHPDLDTRINYLARVAEENDWALAETQPLPTALTAAIENISEEDWLSPK